MAIIFTNTVQILIAYFPLLTDARPLLARQFGLPIARIGPKGNVITLCRTFGLRFFRDTLHMQHFGMDLTEFVIKHV